MVFSSEYLTLLHNRLATHADLGIVAKRYEFINNQIQGTDVAQTLSCWLSYPILDLNQKYHTVLATDEYFTYADQQDQQALIEQVVNTVKSRLIITVRDFKNTSRYDLNMNFAINTESGSLIITENARPSADDRQGWSHDSYLIEHPVAQNVQITHIGTVQRRAAYFKQLAKFCFDAGCQNFQVVPNVLFKPPFKRHAEHIILVDF